MHPKSQSAFHVLRPKDFRRALRCLAFGMGTGRKTFGVCEFFGFWCVKLIGIGLLLLLAQVGAEQTYNFAVLHISPSAPSSCSFHRVHNGFKVIQTKEHCAVFLTPIHFCSYAMSQGGQIEILQMPKLRLKESQYPLFSNKIPKVQLVALLSSCVMTVHWEMYLLESTF